MNSLRRASNRARVDGSRRRSARLDVLETIRLRVEHPRIDEAGDVRMIQPAENLSLDPKTLLSRASDPRSVHEFDRDRAFVAAVGPMGAPDAAHSPAADFGVDEIRAHTPSDEGRGGEFGGRGGDRS